MAAMDLRKLIHLSLLFCPLLLSFQFESAGASAHIYAFHPFHYVGNPPLLYCGSDGIFASSRSFRHLFIILLYISILVLCVYPYSLVSSRFANITLWRTIDNNCSLKGHKTGQFQAGIFEASDRNNIDGSAYGGQRSICCIPDLAKLQGCKQGEIIRIPSAHDPRWPIFLRVRFKGKRLSAKMGDTEILITKPVIYNLLFISRDPQLKDLKMTDRLFGKIPTAIFLSLFSNGLRCFFGTCIMQILTTRGEAFSLTTWVVGTLCFHGIWVVNSTLGGLTSKVLLVGVTYFIATEMLDIAENIGIIDDISGRAKRFLVLPDAFLNAFLIL